MQQPPTSNAIGLWTLYMREVRRFMKVYTQTMLAPVVTTLLFLAVFTLALGKFRPAVHGVPFSEFLAPGLIMMAIAQNAFANTSSSIMIAKVQGNIVDTLMPPFSPLELVMGIAFGGVTRGILVGLAVTLAMAVVVGLSISNVGLIAYHALMASLMLSLLGRQVRSHGGSDEFRHYAVGLSVGNFLFHRTSARDRPDGSAPEPVLLHDRRVPLRLHRSCRCPALARHHGDGGRQCGALDNLYVDVQKRLQT
jgi:hypothetical protein